MYGFVAFLLIGGFSLAMLLMYYTKDGPFEETETKTKTPKGGYWGSWGKSGKEAKDHLKEVWRHDD